MDAPDKGDEVLDELPKLFLCRIACEPAGFVEDARIASLYRLNVECLSELDPCNLADASYYSPAAPIACLKRIAMGS
jgi:hypothetical protein